MYNKYFLLIYNCKISKRKRTGKIGPGPNSDITVKVIPKFQLKKGKKEEKNLLLY